MADLSHSALILLSNRAIALCSPSLQQPQLMWN